MFTGFRLNFSILQFLFGCFFKTGNKVKSSFGYFGGGEQTLNLLRHSLKKYPIVSKGYVFEILHYTLSRVLGMHSGPFQRGRLFLLLLFMFYYL